MTFIENTLSLALGLAIIGLFIMALQLTSATPESIASCQEVTGYSAERCKNEINR